MFCVDGFDHNSCLPFVTTALDDQSAGIRGDSQYFPVQNKILSVSFPDVPGAEDLGCQLHWRVTMMIGVWAIMPPCFRQGVKL